MEEQQNQQSDEKKRRQQFWIVMAVLNTVLMVGVVLLVVTLPDGSKGKLSSDDSLALSQQQQQQQGLANQTSAPTKSPTMKPTVNPTMEIKDDNSTTINPTDERTQYPGGSSDEGPLQPTNTEEFLADLLKALRLEPSYLGATVPYSGDGSDGSSFYLGKALEWMLEEDQQYYPIGRTMPNILLERFLLAAMYFATNGPNWKYEWEEERSTLSVNFLKSTSVCEWVGEDYMDDQGVFCDENSRVTEIHVNHCMEGFNPLSLA
ncbi:MAG: hypothetical protein SGBAC_008128, partial [Bacillariaceae sp.]